MARTEHFHDPDGPRPNRIVTAATAFVQDEEGRVLLIQRSDNGLWALPGGTQEVGERIATTAERETEEETGYRVRVTDFIGVYSDPDHVIAYADGEVRQQFALSFRAELIGGELATSEESPEVRWIEADELDDVPMHPSVRLRVDHGLQRRAKPYIG
ncbi:NUDIX domain-containing protein [Kineococcus sp. NBC_00420]|uniref:NUDIX domain-containing protein n=1 Tax=Kineococcus sp. NBC_00420 TaxID=2903564 RepID=UPI002E23D81D